ncbi:MAG: glycosyltransferase family 4 protein [Dehalococcoidia bacterium]|nr:glycosyltransferase family 4 protein [Dehalococcoidia bacterium]
MRILQLAPLWETVPPPAYGGTEAVVSLLTEELVRLGHDVTLAASGDSTTSARLLSVYGRSLRRAEDLVDRNPYDWTHIGAALAHAGEFDVVHNHAGELVMAMAALIQTPMLTTTHCMTTPDTGFIWARYRGHYNTISRWQQAHFAEVAPRAGARGYVYNAVDVDTFPFQPAKGDDLLFLSRLAPEKGPQYAIEVAKRTGRRLILAGKVDRYDRQFFEEVVKDLIDGDQIVFVGEADARRKRELYANARCLLMPITWREPFGLVMPEAMACGTPVVAFDRGSVPEVIVHGRTGFVVQDVDEMVDAVRAIDTIDPYACRDHVRQHFSPAIMAARYVHVYEQIVSGRRPATVARPLIRPALPARDGMPATVATSRSAS